MLFLTFAAVMAAELFNTSIERLSDELTDEYNPADWRRKDLSAGGVLVCAFFAVAVGIALFGSRMHFGVYGAGFARGLDVCRVSGDYGCRFMVYCAWPGVGIRGAFCRNKQRSDKPAGPNQNA